MPTTRQNRKPNEALPPHIALANDLLEHGEALHILESSREVYDTFKPPKQWGHRDVPIKDPAEIPEGWTSCDLDIAEDDIDGMIERCYRRIDEGILPDIWEDKLKMYQSMKQTQTDMMNSEPTGLRWEVIQRLESLEKIKKHFDEFGNDNGNTPNVIAIMAAYRSGDLVWSDDPSSVTYWAHGTMITGPKKMEMEEFLAFSQEHGPHGIWVEGMDGYKPEPLGLFQCLPPFHPI